MIASEVQAAIGFDDAVRDRLVVYAEMLAKWQARINLVAPKTLPELWSRHMLDSAQVWPMVRDLGGPLVDLGSGGGFPGLVLAICGRPDVILVESDQRKAIFLREVARATATRVTVEACRIESLRPIRAGIVTARAIATVDTILHYSRRIADLSTVYLLLKGERADEELTEAAIRWKFRLSKASSLSDPRGVILRLEGVTDVLDGP